jgi:hypothetical protein
MNLQALINKFPPYCVNYTSSSVYGQHRNFHFKLIFEYPDGIIKDLRDSFLNHNSNISIYEDIFIRFNSKTFDIKKMIVADINWNLVGLQPSLSVTLTGDMFLETVGCFDFRKFENFYNIEM